jgi:2,3-diketo-5-methylthio-1-phosphopentane phosphatase
MINIFIDFDGTITRGDVGDALFERFGGTESVRAVEAYRRGELSATGCFVAECGACGEVPERDLADFLGSREIDPTFPAFVAFSRERGFNVTVLSDGMDHYIRAILGRHGLGDLPLFSNTLTLEPGDTTGTVRFVPSFPWTDEVCDRCACCKRNHMLNMSADGDAIIYIGEGYSDRCPVQFADLVFAKDDLLKYCEKNSISFYPYSSFSDIRSRLEKLPPPGPDGRSDGIPRRRRALLARRDVFLGG